MFDSAISELPPHGSPYDRGSADRYYGRDFDPHYWPHGTGHGKRVELRDMTPDEIIEYTKGYQEEEDRKVW